MGDSDVLRKAPIPVVAQHDHLPAQRSAALPAVLAVAAGDGRRDWDPLANLRPALGSPLHNTADFVTQDEKWLLEGRYAMEVVEVRPANSTGKSATAGYLQFAIFGPFAGFFQFLAGNPIVEALAVWGLLLIGIALIIGAIARVTAVAGILMMVLFYLSAWPPAHSPFIDDHIIYVLALGFLGIVGAGRLLGVDRLVERTGFVKRVPWLVTFLG